VRTHQHVAVLACTRDEDIRTCASDLRSLAGYLWLAAGRTPAAGAAHDGVHGHTDAAAPLVSMDGRTISVCVWYVLYVVAVGVRGSFVAQLASSAWLLPTLLQNKPLFLHIYPGYN